MAAIIIRAVVKQVFYYRDQRWNC